MYYFDIDRFPPETVRYLQAATRATGHDGGNGGRDDVLSLVLRNAVGKFPMRDPHDATETAASVRVPHFYEGEPGNGRKDIPRAFR